MTHLAGPLAWLAHPSEPAGGAPVADLVAATIAGVAAVTALGFVSWRYRRGGATLLRSLAGFAGRVSGLPRWAALPAAVLGGSLVIAVFGFYWDVATHIDNGRDPGPFANPAHYFILAGLAGIALAGWLSMLLIDGERTRTSLSIAGRAVPLGGFLILLCGAVALAGFPLDDVWHRLFGQDITLWGPTHIQMIGGASLSALALWVLVVEADGFRRRGTGSRSWIERNGDALLAGAFLVGLSTLQGEFDYGVPQFSLLYHPVLLMLGASIGLTTARLRVGRWGALKAALFFIVLRAALTLAIGPGLGRITLHLPLYLAEAVLVEAVALRIGTGRKFEFAIGSGVAIGTVGLAAEWAWSRIWMPIAWPVGLLPEAAVLGFAAAIGGAVLGTAIGTALSAAEGRAMPRGATIAAGAAVLLCLALPAPTTVGPPIRAEVDLARSEDSASPTAIATVRLDPPNAADGAYWFHALAWQGYDWERGSSKIVALEETGPGAFTTTGPIPVGGPWKTLVRLHSGDRLLALPLYLPGDPAIPAPEVPAPATFKRAFVADKEIVQREATTSDVWLQRVGYTILLAVGLVWILAMGWGLKRLHDARRPREPVRDEAVAPRVTA